MRLYVAIEGEYEVAWPLGIFSTLELAKKCVEDKKASYGGEVLVWDLDCNAPIGEYRYRERYNADAPWGEKFGPWEWTNMEAVT